MKSHLYVLYILCCMVLMLCYSCKTTKKTDYNHEKSGTVLFPKDQEKQLSKKLGIDILKNDDFIALYREVAEWIDVPYKYGGITKRGCDCSGFVVSVFEKVYGKNLARSSNDIWERNCKKISKSKLNTGDLVFFATGKNKKRINHVGIYLKDDKFIHASSSKGVVISNMNDSYYVRTYIGSGRVIGI